MGKMKIIGHRGAKGLAPENTLASIEKALKHRADEIEIDVRVTRDGVAILHHDPWLVDPDGNKVDIAQSSYAELLRHKPDLTTLDHAIRTVQRRRPMLIELKPGTPIKQTVALIREHLAHGWQASEFSIASYDPKLLIAIKRELPDITVVVNELWSGVRAFSRARRLGTLRVNMYEPWLYTWYIRHAAARGYKLAVFPPQKKRWFLPRSKTDAPDRMKAWAPYLYGVITDRPDLFTKSHE